MTKFEKFINKMKEQLGNDIISMYEFGSNKGELNPSISDIDLLLLCKKKENIPHIISIVRKLELEFFKITHTKMTEFIEKDFLASNDFTGVHLMILTNEDLTKNLKPKSLRLKLLTNFLISLNLFTYELKHHAKLLWGKDCVKKMKVNKVSFADKLKCFTLAFLTLIILPFTCFNSNNFRVWCFKATKYYVDCIEAYSEVYLNKKHIDPMELNIDTKMYKIAKKYRYTPKKFPNSTITLYLNSWKYLLKNMTFLFKKPRKN